MLLAGIHLCGRVAVSLEVAELRVLVLLPEKSDLVPGPVRVLHDLSSELLVLEELVPFGGPGAAQGVVFDLLYLNLAALASRIRFLSRPRARFQKAGVVLRGQPGLELELVILSQIGQLLSSLLRVVRKVVQDYFSYQRSESLAPFLGNPRE